jgi:exopolysaccharide biosynthesis polyprenyl glycosylphosphotransferase
MRSIDIGRLSDEPSVAALARNSQSPRRALIVGTVNAGVLIARDLLERSKEGILPVAFVDDDAAKQGTWVSGLPVVGTLRDLLRCVAEWNVQVVFVAVPPASGRRRKSEADEASFRECVEPLYQQGIAVYPVTDFYERVWKKVPSLCLRDDWFDSASGFRLLKDPFSEQGKRVFDLVAAALLLLFLSPVMLLAALAVAVDSPGSVFYSQMRTGKNGRPFRVHKFRSMRRDAERLGVAQWAQERDPRVTRVGRWLRLTRVDELPQLWNVLRGDMSLIGPRPERPEFDTQLAEQIPYYDTRYRVKPGISGWAQVMYPYGASVEDAREKLAYDLYYLKNCSVYLDLVITLRTIQVVLFGKGR